MLEREVAAVRTAAYASYTAPRECKQSATVAAHSIAVIITFTKSKKNSPVLQQTLKNVALLTECSQ